MNDDQELTEAIAALRDATKALTEAMQTLNRLLEQRAEETMWISTKEAAQRLGVSRRWLVERCSDGRYKHGTHFINTSDGDRPNYLISVASVRRELQKPPERRNTVRRR